jgi:hypothetical protein
MTNQATGYVRYAYKYILYILIQKSIHYVFIIMYFITDYEMFTRQLLPDE